MNRHGITKLHNEYAQAVDEIYASTPKAVFAAIAVSLATAGGDLLDEATNSILKEWRILHDNGIVPQPPVREPDFGDDGR